MADHSLSSSGSWPVQQILMDLRNPWLRLVGERLQTPDQDTVDYWRVERADSALVLPIWRRQVVVPPAVYRPGLGQTTLDLPGGRVTAGQDPADAAQAILHRELRLETDHILTLERLNIEGWPVNSSFSNQRLFGFRARLTDAAPSFPSGSQFYPFTPAGLRHLLGHLTCLQCRAVVMEGLLGLAPQTEPEQTGE
ncbi:MAG: NUDIX hydrolase [Leptolyngbya sp.]|nr:NUDIX hydrolase [Leptolyngbya sp.]